MTAAQVLALLGGALQIGALVWVWVALYRLFRKRWPGAPFVPWFKRVLAWPVVAWPIRQVRRLWHWLTLPCRSRRRCTRVPPQPRRGALAL